MNRLQGPPGGQIAAARDTFLMTEIPEIDEETLKKLPYWKRWLYKTIRKAQEEKGLTKDISD
jgi:hypothetical protein